METFILWVVIVVLVAMVSSVLGGVATLRGFEKKIKDGFVPRLGEDGNLAWERDRGYVDFQEILDEIKRPNG